MIRTIVTLRTRQRIQHSDARAKAAVAYSKLCLVFPSRGASDVDPDLGDCLRRWTRHEGAHAGSRRPDKKHAAICQ